MDKKTLDDVFSTSDITLKGDAKLESRPTMKSLLVACGKHMYKGVRDGVLAVSDLAKGFSFKTMALAALMASVTVVGVVDKYHSTLPDDIKHSMRVYDAVHDIDEFKRVVDENGSIQHLENYAAIVKSFKESEAQEKVEHAESAFAPCVAPPLPDLKDKNVMELVNIVIEGELDMMRVFADMGAIPKPDTHGGRYLYDALSELREALERQGGIAYESQLASDIQNFESDIASEGGRLTGSDFSSYREVAAGREEAIGQTDSVKPVRLG